MQASLLTIYCLFFFIAVKVVNAQTCTASSLISNFTSSQALSVRCQVGYAADTHQLQCRPYDVVFNENYGKPCNFTSECLLSFVCSDLSKICVPSKSRKLGEPCLARESCVADLACANGICAPLVDSYEKKLGEKCRYSDYTTNKYYYCASPNKCDYTTYPNYYCFENVYNGVGGFCGINETSFQFVLCNPGSLCNSKTQKCVTTYYNATLGDACNTFTTDSFIDCKSPFYCDAGKCFASAFVGAGESCNYKNTTSYIMNYCNSNFFCGPGSKCATSISSPLGGYCGLNGTDYYSCASGTASCYIDKCVPNVKSNVGGLCEIVNSTGSFSCNSSLYCFNNTCMEKGNLGQSCEHNTNSCNLGLVCRSVLLGSSPRTCENPGKKYDNCTSVSDCQRELFCKRSKCTNLNGDPVGSTCTFHSDCDSGLCLNNICSLNYNETTCSSDTICSNYESKCSCGSGKSTSNSSGKCASLKRCNALQSNINVCLGNNARGPLLTTIFDKYSSVHKACAKEFSQYYSCLRIGLTNAGNVPALPISGLDINADFDIDPAPTKFYKCGATISLGTNTCSGNGDCVADEVCKCYSGYFGSYCQSKVIPKPSNPIVPNKSLGNNNGGGSNRNETNPTSGFAANNSKENLLLLTFNMIILFLGISFQ
ncbi:predicted protein [Naegleria gruberi]|uniref:Predicted protein n=1 Tax=Naegleria gruberi TaxID=5762 RepID=D2VD25_NAEGR|nr:uncharacterized protein NAEGRDRAFT_66884 [Naegleria gruberi]EFC45161.1 predicted protein [Naegleria gruberi]|eukprot:XP_002677905.1 predicted protein [Naegleria gruberi strain NEG-M]